MRTDRLQLIGHVDLAELLLVHRSTIARWVQAGTFPAPIRTGPRRKAWMRGDIEDWMRERQGVAAEFVSGVAAAVTEDPRSS